ncbi:MAG TPA: 6-carboxytetrahydropterin synthase QueD [Planctomycetota bacterium]|nr:6-carboxytetrahydropterin synthase QueD [Planctomycetota bacterium]
MYELVYETHFAAAHHLRGYSGSCERLHGHNWKVIVLVRAAQLNELGMVLDFRDVKAHVDGLLNSLDHEYLNDLAPFTVANPTTENIAKWVFDELGKLLPKAVSVRKVTVWESERCGASYMLDCDAIR